MPGRVSVIGGQNLLPHTDLANASYWATGNLTSVTANVATAPDGTNTAYRLLDNNVSGQHYIEWGGTGGALPPGPQCFSVYYNPGLSTIKHVALRAISNGWSNVFNFTSTPIIDIASLLAGTPTNYDWWIGEGIQDVGGGWYRLWSTMVSGIAGQGLGVGNVSGTQRRFYLKPVSYVGDSTGTAVIWGPQVNYGIYPTAYRPNTSGAAVGSAQRQPRRPANIVAWQGYGSDRTSDDGLGLSLAPAAWYRGASPGLYNAQGIWTDLSGNARHTTPQSASRPAPRVGINQRECLSFGAVSNQALVVPAQNFDTFTLFVVMKLTGSNGTILVTKAAGFPDGGYLHTSYSSISVQRNNIQVAKGLSVGWGVDNVARSVIMTYGGTLATLNMHIGGVLQSQTTTATGTMAAGNISQQIFIGASESGTQAISGLIGEVRMYPGVLNAADIAKLTAYSQSYWRV